jgi:hypothetical protein
MPRRRNVVSVPIDVGHPKSIARAVQQVKRAAKRLAPEHQAAMGFTASQLRVKVFGPMLRALRVYPPRKLGMRIRWKSPKQRRYVMALLRRQAIARGVENPQGKDLAYRRTNKLKRGWKYDLIVDKNGLRLIVQNVATTRYRGRERRYHQYVSGNIGTGTSRRSRTRYRRPIQPFHKDRGWNEAAPIIQKYLDKAREMAQELYLARMKGI